MDAIVQRFRFCLCCLDIDPTVLLLCSAPRPTSLDSKGDDICPQISAIYAQCCQVALDDSE